MTNDLVKCQCCHKYYTEDDMYDEIECIHCFIAVEEYGRNEEAGTESRIIIEGFGIPTKYADMFAGLES